MNALVASVIRTIVPVIVGQVASWLLLAHVVLPQVALTGLSSFVGGLLTAIYYVGVRVLEQQWPTFGILLGLPSTPDTYSKDNAAQTSEPAATTATVTVQADAPAKSFPADQVAAVTEDAPVVSVTA